ncbi:MAG TPA: S-methyl-5-thioribose kinase [Clostridiales bacterium]|nr:S-methyl-5-thioribose kinase [Clostridiales bacterium]
MFSRYRKLNEKDSIKYIKEKMDVFGEDENLISREIGDGNINYVYKISSKDSKFSVIVKQADKILRSSGRELDTDRIRIEAEAMMHQGRCKEGMVPKIYLYDEIMHAIIMEDLSEYEIMRKSLLENNIYKNFAENISSFIVDTSLATTDLVIDPMDKKKMMKNFISPEICEISERLVFTEPYFDIDDNTYEKENEQFIRENLYKNSKLHLEVGKLKNEFMTNAQALIHGDLHTGSIFVKGDKIKVIDSEFSFFGPIGYDLGNIVANLFFIKIRNYLLKDNSREFDRWLTGTVESTVDLFKEKFLDYLVVNTKDKILKSPDFHQWYLNKVMEYTSGAAGLEVIRRVIGSAKVEDFEGLEDKDIKSSAERIAVKFAVELILRRSSIKKGLDYIKVFERVIEEEI